MLKKFISFYKPYRSLFVLDLIAAFIASMCDLVYPMMTRDLLNDSIPNKNLKMIGMFAVVLIIIFIIKAACGYFMQYFGHVIGVKMQGDMRRDVFKHLQKLPNSYFDNNKTGDIMSRIINDLMEISELAHHGPEDLFISIIMFLGSFIILCTINVPLTIIIFAFVPFIVIYTLKKREKMNKCFMETRVHTSAINSTLENSIAGIRISKAFVAEEYENEKVRLQGIIDCFFEYNGESILLDYKTDYVSKDNEAELQKKYIKQLDYYSDAVFKITGKKVSKRYLYSFYLEKEILVEVN